MTSLTTAQHIGIVGCSAEGAALCYRTICAAGASALGGHGHPEISMHTPSFERYMECLRDDDWAGVATIMVASADKLADGGADFLICPDNTVHQAFNSVASRTRLPWIHIADVVAEEAVRRGSGARASLARAGSSTVTSIPRSCARPRVRAAELRRAP